MFKYFQTTTILLGFCFLLSVMWSYLQYQWKYGKPNSSKTSTVSGMPFVPVLLVAPLLLVVGFRVFGFNFIYPVTFDSSFSDLLLAGIVPAFVLGYASGLIPSITSSVRSEIDFWSQKPFVLMMTASGLYPKKMMRRLVTTRALLISWMRCMPWLFGEMIIIEVIFNAPGLGLDAWNMAKQRNIGALLQSLMWLGSLYVVCVFLAQYGHKKIGKRLESYA
jgi:ABC-type dipeptide/oligopeptide/nickel transport system permease component